MPLPVKEFASIPAHIVLNQTLTATMVRVYAVIALYPEGLPLNEIADKAGITRRHATRVIHDLFRRGSIDMFTEGAVQVFYQTGEFEWLSETTQESGQSQDVRDPTELKMAEDTGFLSPKTQSTRMETQQSSPPRSKLPPTSLEPLKLSAGDSSRRSRRARRIGLLTSKTDPSSSPSSTKNSVSSPSRKSKIEMEAIRKRASELVQKYVDARGDWGDEPWKWTGKRIREQAVKNIITLLTKRKTTLDELEEIVDYYLESLRVADYPYKVSNFFGQAGYWEEAKEGILEAGFESIPGNVMPLSEIYGGSAFDAELKARIENRQLYIEDRRFCEKIGIDMRSMLT